MLVLSEKVLAQTLGVSALLVRRWIQSGWLIRVSRPDSDDVLIAFDSLLGFLDSRNLAGHFETLRATGVEYPVSGDEFK